MSRAGRAGPLPWSLALGLALLTGGCGDDAAPPKKERYALVHKQGSGPKRFEAAAEKALPAAKVDRLRQLTAGITAAELRSTVEKLASWSTRHSSSPMSVEAGQWIRDELLKAGFTDVSLETIHEPGILGQNVVCTSTGTDPAKPMIVVGAHYDSRSSSLSDPQAPAPGADDNASGVALLLAMARTIGPLGLDRRVRFLAFCGEEQGLLGAIQHAAALQTAGMPVHFMLNADMVGFPPNDRTLTVERDEGNASATNDAPSHALADVLSEVCEGVFGLDVRLGPIYSSDYMPFEARGHVTVGLYEGGANPNYHAGSDAPGTLDFDWFALVARSATAFVVEQAQ